MTQTTLPGTSTLLNYYDTVDSIPSKRGYPKGVTTADAKDLQDYKTEAMIQVVRSYKFLQYVANLKSYIWKGIFTCNI